MITKGILGITAVSASVFGAAICIKSFIGPPNYVGKERLSGKTVIVTGASTGIGAKLAYDMAHRGARVIMACRNIRLCQDHMYRIIDHTHNRQVFCRELDLASLESIRRFVKEIDRDEKKVDLLINNAAVMNLPTREVTEELIERQFGVNFVGSFLLTHLLLDHLKVASSSRIVMIVCKEYSKGKFDLNNLNFEGNYDPEDAYAQSQLAKLLFGKELAHYLDNSNVSVFMVDPGLTNTKIRRHMSYNNYLLSRGPMELVNWLLLRPIWQSVGSILYCSLSPDMGKEQSGQLISDFKTVKLPNSVDDPILAQKVWAVGMKWSRLSESTNTKKTNNATL